MYDLPTYYHEFLTNAQMQLSAYRDVTKNIIDHQTEVYVGNNNNNILYDFRISDIDRIIGIMYKYNRYTCLMHLAEID